MSTCSLMSQRSAEPLAGTAAVATTWLLVEQPGPWGGKAVTESHLAPALGGALEAAASSTGVRVALIRRPGRHPVPDGPTVPHQVFLAHTRPGDSWIRAARLDDLESLRELDFAALGAGDHGQLWDPYRGSPLALICTNGKRDRCCALRGRPLIAELAASGMAGLWEITHLGGHRFAPTALILPYGYAYGRLSAPTVKNVLEAVRDGRVITEGCRGRSAWSRPGQAADLAVREATGETGADSLAVVRTEGAEPAWTVIVAHQDGRRWRVEVVGDTSVSSPASCGAASASQLRMDVTRVVPDHGTE